MEWRDVQIGTALTSILFISGKSLIGLYLGYSASAPYMGRLVPYYGSPPGLLLIPDIVFGAEFTQVYASQFGSVVLPADNTEPLSASGIRESVRPEMRLGYGRSSRTRSNRRNMFT